MAKEKPKIIIKKVKRKGHAAHHGGSWKVAYADFVTAMMAFFLVLWILGMDESIKKAIEGYFINPMGTPEGYAAGSSPVADGGQSAMPAASIRLIARSAEEKSFQALARRIRSRIIHADGLGSIAAQIEVVMTEQGLRIELLEGNSGDTFFAFGSAKLTPAAARAITVIANALKDSSAPVVVEGHTDSAPFGSPGYSNWELSADRANAARRQLQKAGIGPDRIQEVRGYADHNLRNPANPLDPENRRISILLPFSTPPPRIEGTTVAPGAA